MPLRIKRHASLVRSIWPGRNTVAGEAGGLGLPEQPRFRSRPSAFRTLAEAVVRVVFGRRDRRVVAVDPDRPAMEEMPDLAAERLDQLLACSRA